MHVTDHFLHKPLKLRRGPSDSLWHALKLVESQRTDKGSFYFVVFFRLLDSLMIPATRRSFRWRLTSSISAGQMCRERSRKGRGSLSLIWWVTPLAKPTSHSSVDNTLLHSANFRRNLLSQAAAMFASPKLNNSGLISLLDSWTPWATVTVSVGNTWAITVPAGIERSLLVSLWIKTLKLFTSTAEEGSTTGETNSPAGSGSTDKVSMRKISFLKGLSDSTLYKGYRSPQDGTLKVPGPSHFTWPLGRSGFWQFWWVWILREWALFVMLVVPLQAITRWKKLAFVPMITGNCGGPWVSGQTKARIAMVSSAPLREIGNKTLMTMYPL